MIKQRHWKFYWHRLIACQLLLLCFQFSLQAQQTRHLDLPKDSALTITRLIAKKSSAAEINEFLPNFKNLIYLDLSSSKIDSFPKVICELKELRFLNLGNTDIARLDACICELMNLERLELWDTNVYRMPLCLNDMPNLKVIDLIGVKYNAAEHDTVRMNFPNLKLKLSEPCDCVFEEGN